MSTVPPAPVKKNFLPMKFWSTAQSSMAWHNIMGAHGWISPYLVRSLYGLSRAMAIFSWRFTKGTRHSTFGSTPRQTRIGLKHFGWSCPWGRVPTPWTGSWSRFLWTTPDNTFAARVKRRWHCPWSWPREWGEKSIMFGLCQFHAHLETAFLQGPFSAEIFKWVLFSTFYDKEAYFVNKCYWTLLPSLPRVKLAQKAHILREYESTCVTRYWWHGRVGTMDPLLMGPSPRPSWTHLPMGNPRRATSIHTWILTLGLMPTPGRYSRTFKIGKDRRRLSIGFLLSTWTRV